MSLSSGKFQSFLSLNLLLLLAVLLFGTARSQWIVKTLPGFSGDLPFKLETGYVSVGEVEFFYYFVESLGNPGADPLLVYLNGGPGCSGLNGFFYQIGPLKFNITNYTGGLPQLLYYQHSWAKTANIIFVDAPVGAGFSYANTAAAYYSSDTIVTQQMYAFIQNGYSIGCPHTDTTIESNSKITFAHRMALVSDKLYETAKKSCNGMYVDVDPSNAVCVEALAAITECIALINRQNILEPDCAFLSPKQNEEVARRSLKANAGNFLLSSPKLRDDLYCHNFDYLLSDIWTNYKSVQEALHVRPGKVKEFVRCNISLDYTVDVNNVVPYHKNLTESGLQVLVFSGDHDMVMPHIGIEQWIKSLDLTIDTDWRPWFIEGQVAGYTRKYTNDGYRLTYATIKGAGHSPQEYKRSECYDMFHRWIHYYPL